MEVLLFLLGLARPEFSSMGKPQGTEDHPLLFPLSGKLELLLSLKTPTPQLSQDSLYRSQKRFPTSGSLLSRASQP